MYKRDAKYEITLTLNLINSIIINIQFNYIERLFFYYLRYPHDIRMKYCGYGWGCQNSCRYPRIRMRSSDTPLPKTTKNITAIDQKIAKKYRKYYSKSVKVPKRTEKYRKEQKSIEKNRKVSKRTEKYRKEQKSTEKNRKVSKTTGM